MALKQMVTWPVYHIDIKLKVMNKEVKSITNMDYAELYFKLKRLNRTPGYGYLEHYPYLKKDKVYILGM